MVHRTLTRLLFLGLPLAPVAGALAAEAANTSDLFVSVAAVCSGLAYGAMTWVMTRCPRCRAATINPSWRFPKFCHSCNLDLTQPRSR